MEYRSRLEEAGELLEQAHSLVGRENWSMSDSRVDLLEGALETARLAERLEELAKHDSLRGTEYAADIRYEVETLTVVSKRLTHWSLGNFNY